MKILLSKLPASGWWQTGIPKYPDNPAMQEGKVPNLGQLEKERRDLISVIQNAGHEVVEYEFPNELDGDNPKHDFKIGSHFQIQNCKIPLSQPP